MAAQPRHHPRGNVAAWEAFNPIRQLGAGPSEGFSAASDFGREGENLLERHCRVSSSSCAATGRVDLRRKRHQVTPFEAGEGGRVVLLRYVYGVPRPGQSFLSVSVQGAGPNVVRFIFDRLTGKKKLSLMRVPRLAWRNRIKLELEKENSKESGASKVGRRLAGDAPQADHSIIA